MVMNRFQRLKFHSLFVCSEFLSIVTMTWAFYAIQLNNASIQLCPTNAQQSFLGVMNFLADLFMFGTMGTSSDNSKGGLHQKKIPTVGCQSAWKP